MNIDNQSDFDSMPDPAKTTLWVLRGLRDSIATDIIEASDSEEMADDIEKLCGYIWARPHNLRSKLTQSLLIRADKFECLWFIIKRIARLEREACGCYVERELLEA